MFLEQQISIRIISINQLRLEYTYLFYILMRERANILNYIIIIISQYYCFNVVVVFFFAKTYASAVSIKS